MRRPADSAGRPSARTSGAPTELRGGGSGIGGVPIMKTKRSRVFPDAPWITAEGAFDPTKFPIDSALRQCVDADPKAFSSGCTLLAMMAGHGRTEAGVFLLGLLRYHQDDLGTLGMVVERLGAFQDGRSAAALFGELRRVPSSNRTRKYLDIVITTLTRMRVDMVQEQFLELAGDSTFSCRMRAKFKTAADAIGRRSGRFHPHGRAYREWLDGPDHLADSDEAETGEAAFEATLTEGGECDHDEDTHEDDEP